MSVVEVNDSLSTHGSAEDDSALRTEMYISVLLPKSVLNNSRPDTSLNSSVEELVFTDVKKAFSLLKKVKGARLKKFTNYEDAFNCSLEGLDDDPKDNEKIECKLECEKATTSFSTPETPELSKLRRAIERGDIDAVRSMVSSNPKFLITSSDAPVILMEGPRYNAVHVASKFNQVDILKYVLNTINDVCFIKRLYPNDADEIAEETRKHLLDLYLNTPDKAGLDTPLHFACKFAAADCVQLLLAYPGCDRDRRNKLGQTAEDVICSRKSSDEAKRRIKNYFEARYYIAISRNLDRVTVCKPSDTPPKDDSISGIAGPMSPKLANEIYNNLKSPARSRSPRRFRIRLTDGSRGVERIARMECRRNNLNWAEYWPFLGCFIDLASKEGLEKFEEHLKKIHDDLALEQPDDGESSKLLSTSVHSYHERSTMSLLCDRLGSLALTSNQDLHESDVNDQSSSNYSKNPESSDDENDEAYLTPPSSPMFKTAYFVNGKYFTQNDKDAANALSDAQINELNYPYIAHWLKKVTLKQSIPSPFKREGQDTSFRKGVFSPSPYASTPRKSINLIDLITPRRFSFQNNNKYPDTEEEEDEDDENCIYEDSICFTDEGDNVFAADEEKENLKT